MHGHGLRERLLAVSCSHGATTLCRLLVRRFRCKLCGGTVTVLPPGVLVRHLYALRSILRAWWLARRPDPAADGEVYALVGVDRLASGSETHRTGRRRWRSLARWAAKLEQWWPTIAVHGETWRERTTALLRGFVAHAGEAEPSVVEAAVARHVGRGALM